MKLSLENPKVLKPNPWNSNRVGAENMAKLMHSVSDVGFATAVVCRRLPNGDLQILGGHHRVQVAISVGLVEIPVLDLGVVDDKRARKISLLDNSRYGTDDSIALAKVFEEIGMTSKELAEFLPFSTLDLDMISSSVDIDLRELDDMIADDDPEENKFVPEDYQPELRTHDIMKFRIPLADAEKIRQRVEKVMKSQGFTDNDQMTAAGEALAYIINGAKS